MHITEQQIKAQLDGKFVKFLGTYTEKWPFRTVKVDVDFVPQYERKTYSELAQIDGKRGGRIAAKPGKGGFYRAITPEEVLLIRRHAAERVPQTETQALLRMGSETFKRAKVAAGIVLRKWEKV
jgi:predicted methyltransferase